jgi:hypothetical protein
MPLCERVKTSGRIASGAGFRGQGSPIRFRLKDLIQARKNVPSSPENFWFFRTQIEKGSPETPPILGRGHLVAGRTVRTEPPSPSPDASKSDREPAHSIMERGGYPSTTAGRVPEIIIGCRLTRSDIFVAGSHRCVTFRRRIAIQSTGSNPFNQRVGRSVHFAHSVAR